MRYESCACRQPTSEPYRLERDGRSTELEDVGHVLGVVNGHDVPLGQRQTEVQRLGLGAGFGGGNHDQLELRGGVSGVQRAQRVKVILLDQEEHLEATGGVVHESEVLDQLDDDRGFVVDGKQNGIEGQFGLRDGQSFLVRHDVGGVTFRGPSEQVGAIDHPDHVEQREEANDHGDRETEVEHESDDDSNRHSDEDVALAPRDKAPSGHQGHPVGKA